MASSFHESCFVMIGVDNSPQAEEAFDWYIKHVHQQGNRVLVVHAHDLHSPPLPPMKANPEWKKTLEEHEKKLNKLVAKYQNKLESAGIKGEMKTLKGPAGEVILKEAKDRKVNLIVVGTRGLSAVKRAVLGSVSSHVVHHSHCPVLICRGK